MIVNRRSVLSHATWMLLAAAVFVSAGAGCSVTARPGFGSDSSEPFFFLHFGDTQLAAGSGKLAAQKARFAEAVRQANELKPAFVVIAGDLVGARTPPEWAAFDEVLEQFKVPVFLIPGNHDTPDPKTREAYVKKYGKDFYEFTYNNSRFVFLNSEFIRPAFAKLPLAAEQWKFLEDTLDDANKQGNAHIFIVTHCPPYYKLGEIRGGNAYFVWPPADRKRLLALARKHKVEVFACGHLHSTRVVKPGDKAFTIYIAGGTAFLFDRPPVYGYGIFKVRKDGYGQTYVPLDQPLEKTRKLLSVPERAAAQQKQKGSLR